MRTLPSNMYKKNKVDVFFIEFRPYVLINEEINY